VNEYIEVRLYDKDTIIFVGGSPFRQCKYLLLPIPVDELDRFAHVESIDEAAELLDKSQEHEETKEIDIPPEAEFWGHCSNLQAWVEHDYNPNLLHSNLSFPLLRRLIEVGDPLAKEVLTEEVKKRYKDGNASTREFLYRERFLKLIPFDEWLTMIFDIDDINVLIELAEEISFPLEDLVGTTEIKNKRVVELDLSRFELEEFPKSVLKFEFLEVLNLRNNYIKKIPLRIFKLRKLRKLELGSNEIFYIPSSICLLKSLKKLLLSVNRLRTLPRRIGKLKNLEKLSLVGNRIRRLPKSICEITSLRKLSLYDNRLTILPDCLIRLKNLNDLDIRDNNFQGVPEVLIKMKKLKLDEAELDILTNFSKEISFPLEELLFKITIKDGKIIGINLKELEINEFPMTLLNLTSLESLDLHNNQLRKIPKEINYLKNLTELYLSCNRLNIFPDEICNLSKLKILSLGENNLKSIPYSINHLENLEKLRLPHNQIEKIPESLCDLTSLEILSLDGNKLTDFPEGIYKIKNLKFLHLKGNLFKKYPESLNLLFTLRRPSIDIRPENLN